MTICLGLSLLSAPSLFCVKKVTQQSAREEFKQGAIACLKQRGFSSAGSIVLAGDKRPPEDPDNFWRILEEALQAFNPAWSLVKDCNLLFNYGKDAASRVLNKNKSFLKKAELALRTNRKRVGKELGRWAAKATGNKKP